jgi:membrane associated rhomboid family serine protease
MNHLKRVRFQYVTITIIVLNIAVYFLLETDMVFQIGARFIDTFSFRPSDFATLKTFLNDMPEQFRLVTYTFIHGSLWHLFGNMIFLFVFGDNVEDALGHWRYILFYVACGAIAALTHSVMTSSPGVPLIGASGAISGVIGAYLMLHPNIRVWVLMPLPVLPFLPLRFSAAFIIGVWIVYQIVSAIYLSGDATAWWAHVGGFFAGVVLISIMKRPGVRLFDTATGV